MIVGITNTKKKGAIPIPEVQENEERAEFVERCIPIVIEDGTVTDSDQAVAIRNSMYDESKKSIYKGVLFKNKKSEIIVMGQSGKNKQAVPFLKWAGGKTQLLKEIANRFPYKKTDVFTYIEPFVGGGAVLFWVLSNYPRIKKVIINDINADLIDTYSQIKINAEDVVSILTKWEQEYYVLDGNIEKRKEYYYAKRSFFNRRISCQKVQAALFIFLNKTCYNGLYRVNQSNKFNVPIGWQKNTAICNVLNFRKVSASLQKVEIINGDFEKTVEYAEDNSFFYFDPPYKALNKTSNFNAYTKTGFIDAEQVRLRRFCARLESIGHKWMASNSSNAFFDTLYAGCRIDRIFARRNINSNGAKRGQISELLITNKE